jgi:predicted RNA-binding protein with RPS1 domain
MRSQIFAKSLPMPLVYGLLKRLELLNKQLVKIDKIEKSYYNPLFNFVSLIYYIGYFIIDNDKNKELSIKKKEEDESDNKWTVASITDLLGKEELENLKESLTEIQAVVQKIKDTVEAARTVVELIRQLETLLEDIIGAVLNKIIQILENLINNS